MSLYLKYRPVDFNNLVGQSFVKDTLQNAIEKDMTVGAYLLCGPRGTGKTSTARILAKTINCENQKKGNPCLECSICVDFLEEKLVDIIEIDAASHTGVDNIREIIERAQFTPSKTKFKVYIIDEVHMLSKGAFNALLKILEEPPKHVKFILATTETHKVPDTIISRCQRYDFKRIGNNEIKSRLQFIADSESIEIDDKSLDYIIKNSSGGLRNAISLFEQLISDSKIDYNDIVLKLEIVDEDVLGDFLNKLINKDVGVIEVFDKLISDGKNIKLFFRELLFYTKQLSLKLLKSGDDISKYISVLDTLDDTYGKTKNSLDENTTFLIGVLKIINGDSISTKFTDKSTGNNSNDIKQNIKKEVVKKEKIKIKPEGVSHDDLNDVFGESKPEPSSTSNSSNSLQFDINKFIEKLKINGAKGGLTMALRGANISLGKEDFKIGVKTKISKGQVENVDNLALIAKTLNDLGYSDLKIITE